MNDQPLPDWEAMSGQLGLMMPWGIYQVYSQDGGYYAHFVPHPDYHNLLPPRQLRTSSEGEALGVCNTHVKAARTLLEKLATPESSEQCEFRGEKT